MALSSLEGTFHGTCQADPPAADVHPSRFALAGTVSAPWRGARLIGCPNSTPPKSVCE